MIPFAAPGAVLSLQREALLAACTRVLDAGQYILGPEVEAFEREWAGFCGSAEAVGVASGTAALVLALRAAGVGPGDEVLVPAMTAVPTWTAVCETGARPVGVDIEPVRRGIDPAGVDAALTPATRAIVAVHMAGMPADVDALLEIAAPHGITVIEDAAQAHGAQIGERRCGALTDLAAFSFYPTKNLGAVGDAGAVCTSDPGLAHRVRRLREYGGRSAPAEPGLNARLDELQAAMLRVLLVRLRVGLQRRQALAARYLDGLGSVDGLILPTIPADTTPAWHLFAVTCPQRDRLAAGLADRGIGTAIHYDPPPAYAAAFGSVAPGTFPVADAYAATALSLPLHPALSDADADTIIDSVRGVAASLA